jgi:hypothetical protein
MALGFAEKANVDTRNRLLSCSTGRNGLVGEAIEPQW